MTRDLVTTSFALPIGSLDAYIQSANNMPMLTAEKEHELATRLYENNDLEAARELITSQLRYVVRVAQGYSGYGLALSDLIQEGNIGLMKAVKKFNPNKGVRLVSFAVHWIKSEIHEFVIKNWKIVKVATTKAQRKLFFNLRKMKTRLGWFTNEEVNAVAKDLGVKPEEVLVMEQRLNAVNPSFDTPSNDEFDSYSPAAFLKSDSVDPSKQLEQQQRNDFANSNLQTAIAKLDARSQDIVHKRWLQDDKATLHELAAFHNVSAERVRQIETKAMQALKSVLA